MQLGSYLNEQIEYHDDELRSVGEASPTGILLQEVESNDLGTQSEVLF